MTTPTKEQIDEAARYCVDRTEPEEIFTCGPCPLKKEHCYAIFASAYRAKCTEVEELRKALIEVGKRGANPITQYGYGIERPWCRLADDVWGIASKALEGKE